MMEGVDESLELWQYSISTVCWPKTLDQGGFQDGAALVQAWVEAVQRDEAWLGTPGGWKFWKVSGWDFIKKQMTEGLAWGQNNCKNAKKSNSVFQQFKSP